MLGHGDSTGAPSSGHGNGGSGRIRARRRSGRRPRRGPRTGAALAAAAPALPGAVGPVRAGHRRAARRLLTTLAGATAGILVTGLAAPPARAGSGAGEPLGTVARTVGHAHYQPGHCPRTADPAPGLNGARCGTLTVPEDRSRPEGRKITLGVATVPAAHRTADDPIVWLAGGPGDDAVSEIQLALDGSLNRDRDVIFMSQRGTYSADPALTCPGIDGFNARALALRYDARSTGRRHVGATRACHDELEARGVDLGAYNSTESAADYADLRVALGVEQWNVFGISYGTDLALHYMRLHPKGIRSVGIDGVLPPSLAGGAVTWKAAREGFDGLFDACAEQPACNARYPDLKGTFERLVVQLEEDPVTTTVPVPGRPEPAEIVLDGGALVNWLVSATHVAAGVPRSIDELAHGKPQRIAERQAQPAGRRQALARARVRRLLRRVDAVREPGRGDPGGAPRVPVLPPVGGGQRPAARLPPPGLPGLGRAGGGRLGPGRDVQRHTDPRAVRRVRRPDRTEQRGVRRSHAEPVHGADDPLRRPCGLRGLALRAVDHAVVLRHPDRSGQGLPRGSQAARVRDRAVRWASSPGCAATASSSPSCS